jgi:predicted MPP superfamily phosphohydrolase
VTYNEAMEVNISDSKRVSRRKFLRRSLGGLTATAAGAFLYTWRIEPHWVEVVHRPLRLAGLPTKLVGKRILHLSDLHAGPIVDQSFLLGAVERTAELNPDLVVITGDLMHSEGAETISNALEVMRVLPKAPLGRLAVLGNHDYGAGWQQGRVANRFIAELERVEVRTLRNEATAVAGVQFAGTDDLWSGNLDWEKTLGQLRSSEPAIALCHNPDAVDLPELQGFRGWVLAGHTHGGQCKPPFLPPPILPVENRRYVAGEYDIGPGRSMYINRGLGYLRRVRFNARPEITLFTLATA